MAAKLDIVSTATGAFSKTFDNLGLIFQLGLAPYGALFVWLIVLSFIGGATAMLLGQLGGAVASAFLAAPLFRHYLLKETPKTEGFSLNMGDRERNLMIVYIVFTFAGVVLGWMTAGMPFLGLLATLALLFVSVRLILLPPLVALDNPIDVGNAFKRTDGFFWPLFVSLLIVGVITVIFVMLLAALGLVGMGTSGTIAGGPIQALFLAAFQMLFASVYIAFMSSAYEQIVGGADKTPEAITAPDPSDDKPSPDPSSPSDGQ